MNIEFAKAEIARIVDENSLELEKSPEEFFATRTKPLFTSVAHDSNGDKLIFRFGFDRLIKAINKELFIYKQAEEKGWDVFPNLIAGESQENFGWLCYRYIEGKPSGNVYQYDRAVDFEQINNSLWFLAEVKSQEFAEDLFMRRDQASWQRLLNEIIQKKPAALQGQVNELYQLLMSLPAPESSNFVHGDLHPGNIINTSAGIKIIDWETSHFDCFGFDLSFLYIRCFDSVRRNQMVQKLAEMGNAERYGFYYSLGVNLLRDYFEWQLIEDGKNELMDSGQLINGATIAEIGSDLMGEIGKTLELLRSLEK